jgi:hypothetical protein
MFDIESKQLKWNGAVTLTPGTLSEKPVLQACVGEETAE